MGCKAKCPRCGYTLYRALPNTLENSLALAIAGLILFVPAITFPVLSLTLLGNTREDTIISGVYALYDAGYFGIASLVLLGSVIAPFLRLILVCYVSGCLRMSYYPLHLTRYFRWYHRFDEWRMLDVYLLGILVAMVKLVDLGEVTVGIGLYSFVALLLINIMISGSVDENYFWNRIEQGLDNGG
ncbi:MAG: paraquat-inducible protein A [Methylococcales bacterium]